MKYLDFKIVAEHTKSFAETTEELMRVYGRADAHKPERIKPRYKRKNK